jgi:hypothetical protein
MILWRGGEMARVKGTRRIEGGREYLVQKWKVSKRTRREHG